MKNKARIRAAIDETLQNLLLRYVNETSFEGYHKLHDKLQDPITSICWGYHMPFTLG